MRAKRHDKPDNIVDAACRSCGVKIRKHIREVHSWTRRVPTVVDLDEAERAMLESRSEQALDAYLRKKGCFAYPALDINAVREISRATVTVRNGTPAARIVCPPDVPVLKRLANALRRHIERQAGVALPIVRDSGRARLSPSSLNLIVLGGSHENRLARRLAFHGVSYADQGVPGPGGCLVNTVPAFYKTRGNIVLIAADRSSAAEAVRFLSESHQCLSDGVWGFPHLQYARLGNGLKVGSGRHLMRAVGLDPARAAHQPARGDPARVAALYDSGGFKRNRYNRWPVDQAPLALQLYRLTSEVDYLHAYKLLLWGLLTYHLNKAGGASYISDFDFALGPLLVSWSMAESEPVFNDEERLVVTNTLLAAARQIHRYKEAFWPSPRGRLRHNHETFPALSLYHAASYFGTFYGIPDAAAWRTLAAECFSGPIGKVCKHTENAFGYQWLVPLHKLEYDVLSNGLEIVRNGMARRTARSLAAAVDNFGYGLDYGDTGAPLRSAAHMLPFFDSVAALSRDTTVAWVARHVGKRHPPAVPSVHAGRHCPMPGKRPAVNRWERLALDDHIRRAFAPRLPREYVADKIGFRTGWQDSAQCFFFSPYSCDSHSHYDMNSILRYNHLGRVWLVDNGYGRPSGITNVARSFSERQRGPQDHNTVIFWKTNREPAVPPPFCAILTLTRRKDLYLLQSALCGIDGADWLRTVLLRRGSFLLVVDQITAGAGHAAVECQLNALGEDELEGRIWRLEQQGVRLFVQCTGAGSLKTGAYMNQNWTGEFGRRGYPYAAAPIRKLSQLVRKPGAGEKILFATLIAATTRREPTCRLDGGGQDGSLRVRGTFSAGIRFANERLRLHTDADRLDMALVRDWRLPAGLRRDMFRSKTVRRRP
ncbi:MAG: heparinase II/III family protein [Kiritimatiellae bacterium]|nr:heparinase II/III family protein [Kiritimatiellia bacterium]